MTLTPLRTQPWICSVRVGIEVNPLERLAGASLGCDSSWPRPPRCGHQRLPATPEALRTLNDLVRDDHGAFLLTLCPPGRERDLLPLLHHRDLMALTGVLLLLARRNGQWALDALTDAIREHALDSTLSSALISAIIPLDARERTGPSTAGHPGIPSPSVLLIWRRLWNGAAVYGSLPATRIRSCPDQGGFSVRWRVLPALAVACVSRPGRNGEGRDEESGRVAALIPQPYPDMHRNATVIGGHDVRRPSRWCGVCVSIRRCISQWEWMLAEFPVGTRVGSDASHGSTG